MPRLGTAVGAGPGRFCALQQACDVKADDRRPENLAGRVLDVRADLQQVHLDGEVRPLEAEADGLRGRAPAPEEGADSEHRPHADPRLRVADRRQRAARLLVCSFPVRLFALPPAMINR